MNTGIQRISSYTSYKASGVDWIGEVPHHWDVVRFKHGLSLVTEKGGEEDHKIALENIESWTGGYIETDTTYEGEGTSFRAGDILFGKLRPYLAKALLAVSNGQAVGDFHVLRPTAQTDPRFAQYFVLSRDFIAIVDGSTYGAKMPRASWDFISSLPLPLPPVAEQASITAFLDRETAKIDALVEEQKRLIDLLKEKRQAVISHAVTKGVSPNVPMKDTGVEWLGEVPEHWQTLPLRALFRFVKRQNGDELEVLSVYRDHGVISKASRDDNINKTPDDLSAYQTVQMGDLVVNKMKAWQGSVGISTLFGITSPDYAVFQPTHDGHGGYFNWLFRCNLFPSVYRSISNGIRPDQWRLEPDRFKELKLSIPPFEEQLLIDKHLQGIVGRLERLSAVAETAVAILQERRSALISAAVTGKIKVPESTGRELRQDAVRAAIGLEIVARLAHRPTFGRVKLQKIVYLVETYAGVGELGGHYLREAAGPLDRQLISDMESLLRRDGNVVIEQPDGRGSVVAYRFVGATRTGRDELDRVLAARKDKFEQVLDKVGDLDTKGAEAVATLFAVWNDALLDKKTITDEVIVSGVLTEWHPEKPLKFKPDELHRWLGWMRRNGIVPSGNGPHTEIGRLLL